MKSLLIAEDEKLIRQGISTMVKRSGVPVETIIECANGEQALEVLKEQDIDVLFTDIRYVDFLYATCKPFVFGNNVGNYIINVIAVKFCF